MRRPISAFPFVIVEPEHQNTDRVERKHANQKWNNSVLLQERSDCHAAVIILTYMV